MPLASGTSLGPYEIVSPLGAGGMGEVYRARDSRLKREVAIKVLPAALSADPDRLRRFEQEAQSASGLNHPAILAIYDFGTHEGAPYIVSELLEGETLRSRLSGGALTPRRAIEYAVQLARGLAAAHEKGIVHRDLKPENVFVTEDGRVKILDFGLARVTQPEALAGGTNLPTAAPGTEPGVVLGTIGYMSPEQVRGKPAEARSDIFSFGAILYEMLSGRRAFHGESAADTMSAILTKEPPDLSEGNRRVPEALDRIVRHCLEKNPQARFHSASDVAFDLEAVSGASAPAVAAGAGRSVRSRQFSLRSVLVVAIAAAAFAAWVLLDRTFRKPSPPTFRQLTFRRGDVKEAWFTPDGQSVVYSAIWGGEPIRIFSLRLGGPDSSVLSLPDAFLFSISRSGELALGLRPNTSEFVPVSTLARAPLSGGAPREVLESTLQADFSPDGRELAAAHMVAGKTRLEFPIGKVLFETTGWFRDLRVSPKGDSVAVSHLPVIGDTIGSVLLIDSAARSRTLSSSWYDIGGVRWSPSGDEIWFSASMSGTRDSVWAVTPSGRRRLVFEAPGSIGLKAIAPDGRALVTLGSYRCSILGAAPEDTAERDYSWLDFSVPIDFSADGKTLLFEEWGEGGGPKGSVYLRRFDGSPPVRLGEGLALGLSPDGQWALARTYTEPPRLVLLPTGAGQSRDVPRSEGLRYEEWGRFFPGGERIAFRATEPGHRPRFYVQDLRSGRPRPFTDEGFIGYVGADASLISPDGRLVAVPSPDRRIVIVPVDGGESRFLPDAGYPDYVVRWGEDSASLFLSRTEGSVTRVFRVDAATGRRDLWKEFHPDPAGLLPSNTAIVMAADGKAYFLSYQHRLNDLYLAEGLR